MKELATQTKHRQKTNDVIHEMIIALDVFLHPKLDRPELICLGDYCMKENEEDEAGTNVFNIQHVPSTRCSPSQPEMIGLMHLIFNANERRHCENVLNHESTQAFNLIFFNDTGDTSTSKTALISTIVFSIIEDEKKPFMFVYYRCTNPRSLNSRKDTGEDFADFGNKMNGIGIGHLLLRVAQQYLCEITEEMETYTVYLFANPNLVQEHYSKLGFRNLGQVRKSLRNKAYQNASEELKECFQLEGAYNTDLNLQVIETPLKRDTVDFRRLISRHTIPRLPTLTHTNANEEMKRMTQVMEMDANCVLSGITDEESNGFVREFIANGYPLDNPFGHMLEVISNSSIMYLEHIISMYENTMVVNRVTGQVIDAPNPTKTYENGINGVGRNIFPMSETDKLFLSQFGFAVDFTGTLDKTGSLLHFTHGFIVCNKCMNVIHDDMLDVMELLQFGPDIMHYHLTNDFNSLGLLLTKA